eukprot:Em0013g20a
MAAEKAFKDHGCVPDVVDKAPTELAETPTHHLVKNPIRREWKHWVVVDIPGCDVAKGTVLAQYVWLRTTTGYRAPPLHIPGVQAPSDVKFHEKVLGMTADGRANWKVQDFAATYKLGKPVAGNFYQAEYDDYVPILYSKFK